LDEADEQVDERAHQPAIHVGIQNHQQRSQELIQPLDELTSDFPIHGGQDLFFRGMYAILFVHQRTLLRVVG
jgi:hypothetical protein